MPTTTRHVQTCNSTNYHGSSEGDAVRHQEARQNRRRSRETPPRKSSKVLVWDCIEKRKVKMLKGELYDIVGSDNVKTQDISRKDALRGHVDIPEGEMIVTITALDRWKCIIGQYHTLYKVIKPA